MISEVIKNYINRMQKFSNKEKEILNIIFNDFDENNRNNIDFGDSIQTMKKLTENENKILHLKKLLYSMDELTIHENKEAKENLANKITEPINIIKKLELMILIKQQIVGKKIRKFNVGRYYSRAIVPDSIKNTTITSRLIGDNKVEFRGHINAILTPYYDTTYKLITNSYYGSAENTPLGGWCLSGDFKTLKFEHGSDKNWKYDRTFSAIKE
jgi:hypothetical protein